jgi:DNA-directed RNA polymerase specialized sigma subunit
MSPSLNKALERFDRLTEKQLSEIARKMIRGAVELERKAKTRGLQKA